jgi:hypothetical protein
LHDEIAVLVYPDPVHRRDTRVVGREGSTWQVIGFGDGFFAYTVDVGREIFSGAAGPVVDDDGESGLGDIGCHWPAHAAQSDSAGGRRVAIAQRSAKVSTARM